MKYYQYILFGMLLFILSSCNYQQRTEKDILNIQRIDTITIKKSVLKQIHSYIAKHPEADSYILKSMQWYKDKSIEDNIEGTGIRKVYNEIYEIACANTFSFDKGEFTISRNYPGQYFEMDNKIVFVCSDCDALHNQKLLKEEYLRLVTKDVNSSLEYFVVHDLEDKTISLSKDEVYGSEYIKQINNMIKVVSKIKFKAPIVQQHK